MMVSGVLVEEKALAAEMDQMIQHEQVTVTKRIFEQVSLLTLDRNSA